MKILKKKKLIVAIIVAVIGALATIVAATIENEKIINISSCKGGNAINGDVNSVITINEIQVDETKEQNDERERPYTVRQTFTSEQSGEPGIKYNFVCVDSKLEGSCYVTYYTYDVTYY